MLPKPLSPLLLASAMCTGLFAFSPAARADADVVPLGNDTYSITCEAKTAFTRNADKLKGQASDEATKFCATQGKQLKILSLSGNVPHFGSGYAKAKITFMALSAGDPRLSTEAAATAAAAPAPIAVAAVAPGRLSTDELYAELVKLDDLRKKNILSDEEFQAEKKKLLSRSN
jgi:hypothetical protein